MTATITATPDPLNVPPRMQLVVSGMAAASTVTISRIDVRSNATPIRLGNPATLTGGGWTGFDYEAPFGQAVTYRAVPDTGAAASSVAHAIAVEQPWLCHPGLPSLSMPVTIAARGDETMDASQSVKFVLERPDPVVRTDGVRRPPTFDLTLRTWALDEEDALDSLLADSSPLLLQTVYPDVERVGYEWLSVGPVARSHLVPWQGNLVRHWTMSCTTVIAPSGLLQAQRTVADVAAQFATVAQAKLPTPQCATSCSTTASAPDAADQRPGARGHPAIGPYPLDRNPHRPGDRQLDEAADRRRHRDDRLDAVHPPQPRVDHAGRPGPVRHPGHPRRRDRRPATDRVRRRQGRAVPSGHVHRRLRPARVWSGRRPRADRAGPLAQGATQPVRGLPIQRAHQHGLAGDQAPGRGGVAGTTYPFPGWASIDTSATTKVSPRTGLAERSPLPPPLPRARPIAYCGATHPEPPWSRCSASSPICSTSMRGS